MFGIVYGVYELCNQEESELNKQFLRTQQRLEQNTGITVLDSTWLMIVFSFWISSIISILTGALLDKTWMTIWGSILLIFTTLYLGLYLMYKKMKINNKFLTLIFPREKLKIKQDLLFLVWANCILAIIGIASSVVLIVVGKLGGVHLISIIFYMVLNVIAIFCGLGIFYISHFLPVEFNVYIKYLALFCFFIGTIYAIYMFLNIDEIIQKISYSEDHLSEDSL
ncbi:hypothetical protein ELUMI_v1c03760 [Williamsoniiplasma luminosum]|uniref:Uncharacterized protein n=1 Tax=Williamsoniiplasma luminosum TaxID=214888 RepID=A0A2K8NWI7_9MOLU|nr:hypothetical protein [Williamsoniiplasma luminosum]ATZ17101.1 hypothetical protein ELUMI_v1c03760 [Williamsoniiplasma luminosum]